MIDTYLTTFPWDLLDEGLDAALDRLHGQVGLTGVCVWAASPPVRYLRTRDVKPRFFRTRGGLFFHPDVPRYESTRCRPLVAAAATAEDPLVRIADACAEHRLALRMIVAAATAPRLARAQPEMAAKNLFGDVSRRTVCLANPNVEAYLCTLAADLSSRRHVSGVILADMGIGWGEATEPPPVGLEPLGPSDRTLLSICFCESCRQRAGEHGVDVAAAQRFARAVLEKTLDTGTGPDGGLKAILDESPSLRAWFDWRRAALSALLGRIVEACGGDVVVDRGAPPSGELRRNQPDDSLPAAVVTRVDRLDRLDDANVSLARRSEVRLPASLVGGPDGQRFVTALSQAADLKLAAVCIDDYARLSEPGLARIKQAIRFARREVCE